MTIQNEFGRYEEGEPIGVEQPERWIGCGLTDIGEGLSSAGHGIGDGVGTGIAWAGFWIGLFYFLSRLLP